MGGKTSGPPRYSSEVHAAIIEALNAGAFKSHAARYAGIAPTTLEKWLQDGAKGIAPYDKLHDDVHQAIARDAVRNQAVISQAATGRNKIGDWKAAAWNLEKKHPKLYGRLAELIALRELENKPADKPQDARPYSPWKQPMAANRVDPSKLC